ncbi:hypothetical protein IMSAGC011_02653 [Lachnospiraceae bacterium]|nr:hypothetical protein IMSAGC011_02653 [Lachnospiraceae bacterium]
MERTKRKSKRKIIALGLCMMMLFSTGLLAHAQTTDFTLTVNSSGYQQDNLSKRTLKAGGTDYENKCYVRATNFVGTGTVYVQSIKLTDTSIHSESEIALGSASSVNVRKDKAYNKYAPSGEYYYLQGRFGASASGNTLNVVGRYTP